ncbi:MAG: MnmC family methyltransferase [Bdellovibrionales bacterium]
MSQNLESSSLETFTKWGFLLERTLDGSPTLRLINGTPENGETMHHSGGAFSETVYIYGRALEFTFSEQPDPVVLSVGLGLGYVETLAAAWAVKTGSKKWRLQSFEYVEGLRQAFRAFYEGSWENPIYHEILDRTSTALGVEPQRIRRALQVALQEGRLELKGELTSSQLAPKTFHLICYDAFSAKTNPTLWSEEFLGEVLDSGHPEFCGFSSYACQGNLKRSLKRAHFDMEVRAGFFGKRNCTWAFRGAGPSRRLGN